MDKDRALSYREFLMAIDSVARRAAKGITSYSDALEYENKMSMAGDQGGKNMSEVKHTPGPWRILAPQPYGSGGIIMAHEVSIGSAFAAENWEANARLIAAAPDMLTALKGIVGCVDVGICEYEQEAVLAAIAKAEGLS